MTGFCLPVLTSHTAHLLNNFKITIMPITKEGVIAGQPFEYSHPLGLFNCQYFSSEGCMRMKGPRSGHVIMFDVFEVTERHLKSDHWGSTITIDFSYCSYIEQLLK